MDEAINKVEDVDKLVIGIYDSFKSSALYSGNLTILPDLQAELRVLCKGSSNAYGDIYRWKDIKATNTDIESVYADLYDVINRCNFRSTMLKRLRQQPMMTSNLTSWSSMRARLTLHVPWLTQN